MRALSLCTCCRHYPGAADGRTRRSTHPSVSAFPERVAGSACTLSFSRLAQRSLTLRPAHSRGHLFVTRYPKASDISSPPCLLRLLPAGAVAGWGLHPLESAAFSRRTPKPDLHDLASGWSDRLKPPFASGSPLRGNRRLGQFVEQRLGLFEIGCVEAFGEPAEDWPGMRHTSNRDLSIHAFRVGQPAIGSFRTYPCSAHHS